VGRRRAGPHPAGEPAAAVLALAAWKGRVCMRAPIPAEERIPPVSRVVAEALVRRQGPLRIATRAARLGLSPTMTRTLVVACGAAALDGDVAAEPERRRDELWRTA